MPLRSREWLSGVTNRRLSQGGEGIDEDELSVIEGCLDLEADMGVLKDRATSGSTNDSSDRVTELVSMLSEAAAAKESVEERLPVGGEVDSSGQWLEGRTGFEYEDSDMRFLPTSSKQAFVENGEFTDVTPALDPDSWMDTIPSINIPPADQGIKEVIWVGGDEQKSGQAAASPLSSRESPFGLRDLLGPDIKNHPYVRLPVVEEGVVPRRLRIAVLFARKQIRPSPHFCLLTLKNIYAQKTLDQKRADILVNAVERLISITWIQSQRTPRRTAPRYIVEALGNRFVAIDAIVCAIELVGEHMELPLWWGKFTASFKTNFPLRPPGSRGGELPQLHRNLAKRLVAAMDIYKQGRRPPLGEVYALKKLLFGPELGRHSFKERKWDPWRRDGECD
ncbi:hypothetical protein, conserved [Eimeria maxima]|uniref:Uncharacterized protein n=1 Tax=Eimeria maxima TaxID=5804 RepID=U6MDA5_EIMMA|nr:hypothetical protein, conserved [Eimeria maxima]CDJ59635.1 hypothetical protein, conserved [Eimeria maxima]